MPMFKVQLKRTMIRTLIQWANVEVEAETGDKAKTIAEAIANDDQTGNLEWEDHKDIPEDEDPTEAKAYDWRELKTKRKRG